MTFKDALIDAFTKSKSDVENITAIISAKSMMKADGIFIKDLSPELRDNEKIVCIAVSNNPVAFKYASDRLKSSVEFCTIIARINSMSLKYADVKVFNNKKLCHIAINNNSLSYNFLPLHLRENASLVFKACSVKLKEFDRNKNCTTNKASIWPLNNVDSVTSKVAFLELNIPEKYWYSAEQNAKNFIENIKLFIAKEDLNNFLENVSIGKKNKKLKV